VTDEELDAIESRAKAATPSPWKIGDPNAHSDYLIRAQQTHKEFGVDDWPLLSTANNNPGLGAWPANAAFVCAARDDVPALVAEVRKLRAVLRARQRPSGHFGSDCDLAALDHDGPEPFVCRDDWCKAARAALGDA
jgi:hypothetical protein